MSREKRICHKCKEPIDMDIEKYAVFWDLPYVWFLHETCGNSPEYKELDLDR